MRFARMLLTMLALSTALAAAKSPPAKGILDLDYAPTPEGRVQFMDTVTQTFGPIVALARACGVRTQKWADIVETYVVAVITGPRKGSGEDRPTHAEISYGVAELKTAKAEAAQSFLTDGPAEACKDVRDPDTLREADGWVKKVQAIKPGDWSGFGDAP